MNNMIPFLRLMNSQGESINVSERKMRDGSESGANSGHEQLHLGHKLKFQFGIFDVGINKVNTDLIKCS